MALVCGRQPVQSRDRWMWGPLDFACGNPIKVNIFEDSSRAMESMLDNIAARSTTIAHLCYFFDRGVADLEEAEATLQLTAVEKLRVAGFLVRAKSAIIGVRSSKLGARACFPCHKLAAFVNCLSFLAEVKEALEIIVKDWVDLDAYLVLAWIQLQLGEVKRELAAEGDCFWFWKDRDYNALAWALAENAPVDVERVAKLLCAVDQQMTRSLR